MAQQHSLDLPWESDSKRVFFLRIFFIPKSKFVNTLLPPLSLRNRSESLASPLTFSLKPSLRHRFKSNITWNMSIPNAVSIFNSAYTNDRDWESRNYHRPTMTAFSFFWLALLKEWKGIKTKSEFFFYINLKPGIRSELSLTNKMNLQFGACSRWGDPSLHCLLELTSMELKVIIFPIQFVNCTSSKSSLNSSREI